MNFSDLIFKNESDPADHGSIMPVIHEMGTNFLSNVDISIHMIKTAYDLSTPYTTETSSGGIEPSIKNSNIDTVPTETDEERRERISPAVAQVAAADNITDIQGREQSEARAKIATIYPDYPKAA